MNGNSLNINGSIENSLSSVDQLGKQINPTQSQQIKSEISEVNILPIKSIAEQKNENEDDSFQNNKIEVKNRFSLGQYNPYHWPANIEIANIHEQATSLGKDVLIENTNKNSNEYQNKNQCPCCQLNSNKMQYEWKSVDVTQTLSKKYGTAVPLLFELIKYYCLCIFIIFCINGIYSIYIYKSLCDEYPDSCVKMLNFLPIVSDGTIKNNLSSNKYTIYKWLNFISYIMILTCQIFVDLFCDIREKNQKPRTHLKH